MPARRGEEDPQSYFVYGRAEGGFALRLEGPEPRPKLFFVCFVFYSVKVQQRSTEDPVLICVTRLFVKASGVLSVLC